MTREELIEKLALSAKFDDYLDEAARYESELMSLEEAEAFRSRFASDEVFRWVVQQFLELCRRKARRRSSDEELRAHWVELWDRIAASGGTAPSKERWAELFDEGPEQWNGES